MSAAPEILVAGSTSSGKTTWLASLLRAHGAASTMRRAVTVSAPGGAPDNIALNEYAANLFEGVMPGGTTTSTMYHLVARFRGSVLFDLGSRDVNVTACDPPGGDVFPTPGTPLHAALIALLPRIAHLLLLVPACETLSADFEPRLRALLDVARQSHGDPPFDRVAVAITKADRLAATRRSLLERDPEGVLEGILGAGSALRLLRAAAPEDSISAHLVSSYGFDPEGRPTSFEALRQRAGNTGHASMYWRPVNLCAPLEFLVRGHVAHAQELP